MHFKGKLLIPPKARFKNERSDTDVAFVQYKGIKTEQHDMPKDCAEYDRDFLPFS